MKDDMPESMGDRTDIAMGAEASVTPTVFLGRDAMEKIRPAKGYRLSELDVRLRSSRTRSEARILNETRRVGVRTPCVYDLDLERCSITMERIEGTVVKTYLDENPDGASEVCREIGRTIARLHTAQICHGDLTTSNMIRCNDGSICLIDMSMGRTRAELEDIGMDLRLLERAFSSAHVDLPDSFSELMEEYYSNVPNAKAIAKKLEDIKNRGRYT